MINLLNLSYLFGSIKLRKNFKNIFHLDSRTLNFIFLILLLSGTLISFNFSQLLEFSSEAFDPNVISLMIPYTFSMFYLGACSFAGDLKLKRILLIVILFGCISTPLLPYLKNEFIYLAGDDAGRYSTYAHNMINNKTLWGSDGLIYNGRLEYVDNPGYRYWLAFTLLIFKTQCRAIQLFNSGCLLFISALFLRTLSKKSNQYEFKMIVTYLTLSAPYASQNLLMGLTEWLTVGIFLLLIYFIKNSRPTIAIIILSFIPFLRQNLFIYSLIILFLLSVHYKRISFVWIFSLIAALPVYHNFYFAGKLRFLVSPGFNGSIYANRLPRAGFDFGAIFNYIISAIIRVMEYFGVHSNALSDISLFIISFLFVPFGTYFIFKILNSIRGFDLLLPLLIVSSVVMPTLIFGWAYYPRFPYINQTIVLISILVFKDKDLNIFSQLKYTDITRSRIRI